jgi:transketolase
MEELVQMARRLRRHVVTMIAQAGSGHPGGSLSGVEIVTALYFKVLRHKPQDPCWPDRDRFVLSGGHGSMLLYALLHLTGYELSLEELKAFRQWKSRTPGHPERGLTPGVEVTTGPLGQGFGNAVGMAIAEAHLEAEVKRAGHKVVDHYTYVIATDGDLMEGLSYETASLAGHLRLSKLIVLYDDNHISIDGSTDLTFTEDRKARFEAQGWHVQAVQDGNDVDAVDNAIKKAKEDPRPSLIICRTHIGYGLPKKQDTAEAHGEPPGEEELKGAKLKLGWPVEPRFYIPDDVLKHFREAIGRGRKLESEWKTRMNRYRQAYSDQAAELERRLAGRLKTGWDSDLPSFPADPKGMATRAASGKVINALATRLPEMMGGSADLTASNKTWIDGGPAFQKDTPQGRNLHFGVREHAMGAIVNGLAVHSGIIPFCGTFLVFSDYMRPSIRLSAVSRYPSIWLYTHDSIGLGEDGPTHQPVEHLASLRAIPNVVVIRPADANEVTEAWKIAVARRDGPTILVLSRQNLPVLDRKTTGAASGLKRGAYVLADLGGHPPEIILMASGSEVGLTLRAAEKLSSDGTGVRVVSFPSWELFAAQDKSYRDSVLPPNTTARLAIEAGVSQGWAQWTGDRGAFISIERFGASAPFKVVFEQYGFSVDNIAKRAKGLLA